MRKRARIDVMDGQWGSITQAPCPAATRLSAPAAGLCALWPPRARGRAPRSEPPARPATCYEGGRHTVPLGSRQRLAFPQQLCSPFGATLQLGGQRLLLPMRAETHLRHADETQGLTAGPDHGRLAVSTHSSTHITLAPRGTRPRRPGRHQHRSTAALQLLLVVAARRVAVDPTASQGGAVQGYRWGRGGGCHLE